MYHSDVVQFENLTGVWDLPRGCWFSCCLVWETDLSIVRHRQVCAREYSLACGLWSLIQDIFFYLRRCGGHELKAISFSLPDLISLFGLAVYNCQAVFAVAAAAQKIYKGRVCNLYLADSFGPTSPV